LIEKYEIRKIDNEERLFLYLNINTEFAILGSKNKRKKLDDVIKEYMIRNNITFKGKIISIIIGGIFAGNIILNNNFYNVKKNSSNTLYVSNEIVKMLNNKVINVQDVKEESIDVVKEVESIIQNKKIINTNNTNEENKNVSNNQNNNTIVNNNDKRKENTVVNNTNITYENDSKVEVKEEITSNNYVEEVVDNNIYISLLRNGSYEKIELEEYVSGVVGAEMPASFSIEALKAQAVIARTYALKAHSKGNSLKANESNQSYKTVNELRNMWGGNFNTYYNKILEAVNSTKGVYLSYSGNYIEAVYHSTSNGKTESSSNVWGNYYPYLVSVSSVYDSNNPSYIGSKTLSYSELSSILGIDVNSETLIEINGMTTGDRVASINIGDRNYRGVDLRNLLGLRSADFDITINEDSVTFTTRGYGHGVGLSQYGANGYAKNGYSYRDILLHYYPGVQISYL